MGDCVWFVKESAWLSSIEKGWGNGYVAVPKGHPAYGLNYDKVCNHVDAHWGLTYGELLSNMDWDEIPESIAGKDYYVFGFDTAHYDDTLEKWPKDKVEQHTQLLCKQFDALINHDFRTYEEKCVAACEGMDDPISEVAAMKAALSKASPTHSLKEG